jgi:ketosteroid isomerase-like protein
MPPDGGKMKHRKVLLMAMIASLTLTITSFQAFSADREEEALRVLVPKIVAAWGTLDISKVESYYATDTDFAYFDIAPMKYNNWKEYREGVQKALFEPNRSIKATIDDLRIHRRGSLAWATFTAALDIVSKQGAPSHINARWTMVLEKRSNGWIVVHEHVSAPLGGS